MLKDRLGEILKRTVRRKGGKAVFETPTFDVSDITDHRYDAARNFQYYVVWKNKDIEPSWKPVANLYDINVIKTNWKRIRSTRRPKKQDRTTLRLRGADVMLRANHYMMHMSAMKVIDKRCLDYLKASKDRLQAEGKF